MLLVLIATKFSIYVVLVILRFIVELMAVYMFLTLPVYFHLNIPIRIFLDAE